jgi:glucan phosphorylase
MKELITEFNETGICKVDVKKVSKKWNNKMGVSQYGDEFYLEKFRRGESRAKVKISKEQALGIIKEANLLPIRDSFFKRATSYKRADFIRSEIKRCTD